MTRFGEHPKVIIDEDNVNIYSFSKNNGNRKNNHT